MAFDIAGRNDGARGLESLCGILHMLTGLSPNEQCSALRFPLCGQEEQGVVIDATGDVWRGSAPADVARYLAEYTASEAA